MYYLGLDYDAHVALCGTTVYFTWYYYNYIVYVPLQNFTNTSGLFSTTVERTRTTLSLGKQVTHNERGRGGEHKTTFLSRFAIPL